MKKFRKGNDITIVWSIINKDLPYDMTGKDISLFCETYKGISNVDMFQIKGNIILFTIYGKDQENYGSYTFTLVENLGKPNMITLDICNAFELVEHSCDAEEKVSDTASNCGNIDIVSVELTSNVNIEKIEAVAHWEKILGKPKDFADWNAVEGDEKFIENKPKIPSKVSELDNDKNYLSSVPSEYITEKELESKGYSTKTELSQGLGGKQDKGDYALRGEMNMKADRTEVPTKTSQLTNDSNFADKATTNLMNYYLKKDSYTRYEVDKIIKGLKSVTFDFTSALPTVGQANVIYLVEKTGSPKDYHDEYIWANGRWEMIGTKININDYYTKKDIDKMFTEEAPNDGKMYGRKNGQWVEIV